MTYTDICTIHNVMHCIDCGCIWFDGDGNYIPGTGDWWRQLREGNEK